MVRKFLLSQPTNQWKIGCLKVGLATLLFASSAFYAPERRALAQITPDITLPVNSVVTPDGNITVISGGTQAGDNLFHSFQEFSVPNGGTAYFNNLLNIQNIFSRVTGVSASQIDGSIRANGTANLFLLNPNGIIFGPNAKLDIGGSFLASTASMISFADGTFFSAQISQSPPLLTVSMPIGLQYGSNAGNIQVQHQANLQISSAQTLALLGGNVIVDGGVLNVPGGRIELGGLTEAGSVGLTVKGSHLHLSFTDKIARANVSFINNSEVNVRAADSGSIFIYSQDLNLADGSQMLAGIADGGSINSQAGNIEIDATGTIKLSDARSRISNAVLENSIGEGGNINITAESLSVSNGAALRASTFGQGNAGNININVRNRVSFDGMGSNGFYSGAYSRVERPEAIGRGGNINIKAGSLAITNGAVITGSTDGQGNAGNININVRNFTVLDGVGLYSESLGLRQSSGVYSSIKNNGVGEGGRIRIATRFLSISNGAVVITSTRNQGNGGNIEINAESVNLAGVGANGQTSGLFTPTERRASGKGGDITVNTNTFQVADGAVVSSRTLNSSDGGTITINARTFEAINGGQIIASTLGSGRAGDISLHVSEQVVLSGKDPNFANRPTPDAGDDVSTEGEFSGLFARTSSQSNGAGGNLTVQAGQLIVQDSSRVSVSAEGFGAAGELRITAGSIQLDNGALRAETQAGNFGNIEVRSQNLILRQGSTITTDATQGTATGGNITINTDVLAALEGSDIIARAVEGRGGNIQINTQGIFQSFNSSIDASSRTGINGVVEISTPDVDPSQGIIELPEEIVDASRLIAQGCPADKGNTFTVTGSGGLPPNPSQPLRSNALAVNWVTLPSGSASISPTSAAEKPRRDRLTTPPIAATAIVEAQGWIFNAKGEIVLTTSTPTTIPSHPQSFLTSCQK